MLRIIFLVRKRRNSTLAFKRRRSTRSFGIFLCYYIIIIIWNKVIVYIIIVRIILYLVRNIIHIRIKFGNQSFRSLFTKNRWFKICIRIRLRRWFLLVRIKWLDIIVIILFCIFKNRFAQIFFYLFFLWNNRIIKWLIIFKIFILIRNIKFFYWWWPYVFIFLLLKRIWIYGFMRIKFFLIKIFIFRNLILFIFNFLALLFFLIQILQFFWNINIFNTKRLTRLLEILF